MTVSTRAGSSSPGPGDPATGASAAAGGAADGPGRGGTVDPAERGRLDIARVVVRRIAEHAADVTEGTTTVHRSLVGVGLGDAGSSAKVAGSGDRVDLRIELPVAYPAPIATTIEAVRGNVRERVQTLTGYQVRSVDVRVSALTDPAAGARPARRTE